MDATNSNFSRSLSSGDRIYVSLCGAGGTVNLTNLTGAMVEFGLF